MDDGNVGGWIKGARANESWLKCYGAAGKADSNRENKPHPVYRDKPVN
jgi:hypothetical protein